MSCLPGMPCYDAYKVYTVYPSGCCTDGFLGYPINSDYIYYSGPNLPCTGVQFKDCLTDALQKIDEEICPESMANKILYTISQNPELLSAFCSLVDSCTTTTTTTTVII